MFLSIVNDAFGVAKHDIAHNANQYELGDFVLLKFKSLFCGSNVVEPGSELGIPYIEGEQNPCLTCL